MDINVNNQDIVTREFEWSVQKLKNYLLSNVFEIFLPDSTTKWQLLLYRENDKVYAQLKKVESPINNFILDLSININKKKLQAINRQYDAKYFYETWFYVHTIENDYISGSYGTKVGIPQDSFIMKIKISLIPKSPESVEKCESKCFLPNYERFLNSEALSDFKFVCSDGKEIPAHRFVLIANSPTMYKMLSPNDCKYQKAVIEDVNGETMLQVLRFLYTGKIEDISGFESQLFRCAEKYELDDLNTFVAQSMIKNLSIDNVLNYFELADEFDEDELLEKCIFFIHNNYNALQQQDSWEDFDSKMKTSLKVSYLQNGYKNPVYVLKSLMTYEPSKLPNEYKAFP